MDKAFIADKEFRNINFNQDTLAKGDYENCSFHGCNFSESYLDNQNFMECLFVDCNLSNANLAHTTFKEANFRACKMVGLKFEDCNDLLMSFNFDHCTLNLSSFYKLKIKGVIFNSCKLLGADFTETDLSGARFVDCDLQNAIFGQSILELTDFRTAINFQIDPDKNKLKKAKFSKENVRGLLTKYDICIE